jgi:hypothetical protein
MAKYKRTSLGVKDKLFTEMRPSKNKVTYPSFYVRKKLPIDKKGIGKTFEVKAKIKLTGLSQNTNEDKDSVDYTFDVIEIEF